MVFDPSRPYLVLTSSRSAFFFELFRDMNAMLTSRLRMKANTRSLHALNCRTNNRMLNCSLARTCRACKQTHIHNACFQIFDSAWAVIPRTALEMPQSNSWDLYIRWKKNQTIPTAPGPPRKGTVAGVAKQLG